MLVGHYKVQYRYPIVILPVAKVVFAFRYGELILPARDCCVDRLLQLASRISR